MSLDLTTTNIKNNIRPWVNDTLRQDLFRLKELIPKELGMPLKEISFQSNVPESILNEIADGKTLISDSTIYRFYKFFFKVVDQAALGIRHEWIRLKFLKEKLEKDGEINNSIEASLEGSSVLRKIYLETRLHPVKEKQIVSRYGDDGRIALEVLESYELIKFNSSTEVYKLTNRSISKNPALLKKLMIDCVSMGVNVDKLWGIGDNTCFYGMEWVSQESFEKILNIMDKAKNEIRMCLEEDNGERNIPLIALGAIDKFKSRTLED